MTTRRHDRRIAALAIPALGSLIADPLLSLIDTAFVGRLGGTELAALGVAAAVFGLVFFVFNFLEYGTTSLVADAVGAEDRSRADRAGTTAFFIAAASGLAIIAVGELVAPAALRLMGASGAVLGPSLVYLRIRLLAAPAMLLIRVGHGIYRGNEDTRTPMVLSVGLNVVNLVLDPLLIFGLGWGIAGAAWATVIAQWTGAAAFVFLAFSRRGLGMRLVRPDASEARSQAVIGRDLFIRTSALVGTLTIATAVATRVGDAAVAAHQVVSQLWIFAALAIDALAIAGQAIVGTALGRRDRVTAREAGARAVVLGVVVGVVLGLLALAVRPWLAGWFTTDAEVATAIDSISWFLVIVMPINGAVFAWDGVFFGFSDFRYLAWAMVGSALAAIGVLLLVIPFGWGLAGVWWAITTLSVVRLITLWARWVRGSDSRQLG